MIETNPKVMLVDDNIISAMVTVDVLNQHGYQVIQTTSPNGAIAKVDYENPDVLLIDVDMPRLAFEDLVRSVQNDPAHKGLMIVLFSSRPAPQLHDLCIARILNGYFSKKMDVTRLPEYIGHFF